MVYNADVLFCREKGVCVVSKPTKFSSSLAILMVLTLVTGFSRLSYAAPTIQMAVAPNPPLAKMRTSVVVQAVPPLHLVVAWKHHTPKVFPLNRVAPHTYRTIWIPPTAGRFNLSLWHGPHKLITRLIIVKARQFSSVSPQFLLGFLLVAASLWYWLRTRNFSKR